MKAKLIALNMVDMQWNRIDLPVSCWISADDI